MGLSAIKQSIKRATGLPWVRPGHFYSPIADPNELRKRYNQVFHDDNPVDVDLHTQDQLAMVQRLRSHYLSLPFKSEKSTDRYYYECRNYSYGDAIVLGCMLMELRPKLYIEFGSGFSSCAALDARDAAGLKTNCTFIDPHPELLQNLLAENIPNNYQIIKSAAQDIDLSIIDKLEADDILFIDSTHVSKAGSDVNFHVFNVLPRLKSGVYIHFHDIFFPFEYPPEWFFDSNRSWNEVYLLRAFLAHNNDYEVVLFSHYLSKRFPEIMTEALPMFSLNPGAALWIRKK